MKTTRRSGFTLIEISVVLVIALIISSITFGAFRSISEGNKRTTCQSNLSQIYQSSRLYAQDYSGKFPYFNESAAPNKPATPQGGIGLWALYTFRKSADSNCDAQNPDLPLAQDEIPASGATPPTTLTGYVRSPKIFHCPRDSYDRTVRYQPTSGASACVTQGAKVDSGSLTFVTDGTSPSPAERRLNPAYLSYQSLDEVSPSGSPEPTYSSFRNSSEKRQLTYFVQDSSTGLTSTPERPSNDNTVIAWCRFHRKLKVDPTTGQVLTTAASRNYDNVLFYDGTVQNLPSGQDNSSGTTTACTPGTTGCLTGWQRVPRVRS